jgi:hypothetical protein
VRRRQEAGLLGDGERLRVGLRRPDRLVVGEPERHHARAGPAGGDAGLRDRDRWVDGPVRRHHHAHADAELAGRGGGGVEDHVDDGLVGAEAVAVVGGIERRLHPHRPVEHGVLHHLVDQPCEVVAGLEHLAGGEIGVGERGERPVAADLGNGDPRAVGELGEGRRAHRALEVQVEVGLRERAEVAGRGSRHAEHRRACRCARDSRGRRAGDARAQRRAFLTKSSRP